MATVPGSPPTRGAIGWVALVVMLALPSTARADLAESSGLWLLANLRAPLDDTWSINLETDVRILDNFSQTSELIVQPAILLRVHPDWTVSLQYAYVRKPTSNDENRLVVDTTYHVDIQGVIFGTRLRLTPRFVRDVGVVLRLRYRLSMMWPIAETPAYLSVANELFFNLNNQGDGPVQGFEQDRLIAAVGYHFGSHLRAEGGYMWRPERRRDAETVSDHVVAISFFFSIEPKKRPHEREPHELTQPLSR